MNAPPPKGPSLDGLLDRVLAASNLVVLTGAGMSAESGIPTFRGANGWWRTHRPEDLATADAFARDPVLVWEWYDHRRQRIREAQPHPGYHALANLERRLPRFTVVTQNVDGMHRRAGNRRVLELHGNIMRARCVGEGRVVEDLEVPLAAIPPRCECGELLRPDVVWFGEDLPEQTLEKAFQEVSAADVLLVVGTSCLVYPAAALPGLAARSGARVVEVNPEPTPLTEHVHDSVRAEAGVFLPRLVERLDAV